MSSAKRSATRTKAADNSRADYQRSTYYVTLPLVLDLKRCSLTRHYYLFGPVFSRDQAEKGLAELQRRADEFDLDGTALKIQTRHGRKAGALNAWLKTESDHGKG